MTERTLEIPGDDSSLAIVGMSCRFPGAKTIDEFWENLRNGVESISKFSDEDLLSCGVEAIALKHPQYVKAGAVLADADWFDASFFGIGPKEAEVLDPQHRLFLECAWEAIENAGYNTLTYNGAFGVYAGVGMGTYLLNNLYPQYVTQDTVGEYQFMVSNDKDFLSTRISYLLNLRGPSVNVQTACSTSLVAIHLACQSLLSGECDMALAGGVSVSFPQSAGYLYQEGMILSPDGHCRAFDARAKGTVNGNGVGIVVLKRAEDAVVDGDSIHAIIKGSAINNDGSAKVGYTAPSVSGQAAVIAEAQAIAGVDARTVTYVEAHGTGTALGDPIEIEALTQAFRERTQEAGFCAIGSVKTNIGHTDTAAGVAGVIKTVLALKHKLLVPTLHFESPNPKIDLANSPFYVNSTLSEWKSETNVRRAGVSSFGIGGTNAHIVLEQAQDTKSASKGRGWYLLVLSAKSSTALDCATANLVEHFRRNAGIDVADVAYTLSIGRRAFSHRRMLVCRDLEDATLTLTRQDTKKAFRNLEQSKRPRVVFMFPGQGSQYANMFLDLYENEGTFREQVDRCLKILESDVGIKLGEWMFPQTNRSSEYTQAMQKTVVAQPALFTIQYALARLWMSWGIHPHAMIGHSIGEYTAATLAGVLSLKDALSLVAARGRMMQEVPAGGMLAIFLPEEKVQPLLRERLSLAAVNGSSHCVVSGPKDAVEELEGRLAEKGHQFHRLRTDHAFHSEMMECVVAPLTDKFKTVTLYSPKIPYLSNVTGTWISETQAMEPSYWGRHLRETVRFAPGLQRLMEDPSQVLLEVGPGQTLSALAMSHPDKAPEQIVLSSLDQPQEGKNDTAWVLTALGKLWLAGVEVDWPRVYVHERRHRVPLPTYPFERNRYWVSPKIRRGASNGSESLSRNDLTCQDRDDSGYFFWTPSWKRVNLSLTRVVGESSLSRWLVFMDQCGVGSQISDYLESTGHQVIRVEMGARFEKISESQFILDPRKREDYFTLLEELVTLRIPPRKVLHLWNVTPGAGVATRVLDFQSVAEAEALGFYSLMFLAQALSNQRVPDQIEISVVSNELQQVTGEESLWPPKASLLGPLKVTPLELSNISCRSIDVVLQHARIKKNERLIDQLISEIMSGRAEPIVAYRGIHRWVQVVEPVCLPKSGETVSRLREKGVYLITGGVGGIGLSVAEYLARSVRAKLILTGRSSFPPRDIWEEWLRSHEADDSTSKKIRKVQELEEIGAEVMVTSANVTDEKQMRAVLVDAMARFGHIQGIVHSAGVPGGGIIGLKTQEAAQRVLAPKVQGTVVLESVFKDVSLDFFVLMSSITSIEGEIGQVDYCAANNFIDGFAHYNYINRSTFVVCINWDVWQEVGMAVNAGAPRQLSEWRAESLEIGIIPKDGAEIFGRVLSGSLPQVVVSRRGHATADRPALREVPRLAEGNPALVEPRHPMPSLRDSYVAPRNETEQTIAEIWRELLGIEEIGINDNFFELGGSSLVAIQAIARVRSAFRVELLLRDVLDNPSISRLSTIIKDAQAPGANAAREEG